MTLGHSAGAGLSALTDRLDGHCLFPGDDGFDSARAVWNAMIDRQPRLIVRCSTVDDVVTTVRAARELDLEIGVRCGGHSVLGLCVPEDGLMIDLTPMSSVRVDPERRRAWVQGGALLGALDIAAQQHGLATTAGNISHTGVGGLTLGGGMGYLSRRFGLTIDSLIGADIVTADGKLQHVSEHEEPDLFWAIRGGGGNFGVITRFTFRMHVLGPTVIRRWTYPAEAAADILTRYRDAISDAPRELTTAFVLTSESLFLRAIWSGSTAGADAFMARFGRFPQAVPDPNLAMTFLELQRASDDLLPWGRRYYSKGGFLAAMDDRAVGVMAGSVADMPVPGVEVYGLQLGGAIGDVAEDATAYSGRAAEFYWISQGVWDSPDDDAKGIAWCRRTADRLSALSLKTNYVNEQADTGVARNAYGEAKYRRLANLKWRYDPNNLFRLNQNIEPSRP